MSELEDLHRKAIILHKVVLNARGYTHLGLVNNKTKEASDRAAVEPILLTTLAASKRKRLAEKEKLQ